MIGILCIVEIFQMAGNAVGRQSLEDVVFVTIGTVYGSVCTHQLKLGRCIVIEFGALPLRGVMAKRTVLGKSGGRMIWIFRGCELTLMASRATGGHTPEYTVFMTIRADNRNMRTCQRKLGGITVIEGGSLPL